MRRSLVVHSVTVSNWQLNKEDLSNNKCKIID